MDKQKIQIPDNFKPLLWSLDWTKLDAWEDREDIILAVINGGTMSDWKWISETYGTDAVAKVLGGRLETELYPESRNLAQIMFNVPSFRHAR